MNNFINKLFILSSFITTIFFILVGISWLFDTKPINLWYAFTLSCDSTIVTFLFWLLFGGKRN